MENTQHQNGTESIPILEEPCLVCHGTGFQRGRQGRVKCDVCSGSGYEPTEFGVRVLALMRHNLKPMLQDATDD